MQKFKTVGGMIATLVVTFLFIGVQSAEAQTSIPAISPMQYYGGSTSSIRTVNPRAKVLLGSKSTTTSAFLETPSISIIGLTGQACVGTDGSGNLQAGTCGSGGGGSFSTSSLLSIFSATLPLKLSTTSNSAIFSTLFSTTTDTGLPRNAFMYTGPTGIITTVASSGLALPNTALQNSSVTVNGTVFNLGDSKTINAASSTLLGDRNTWSALQTIAAASTTNLTASNYWMPGQSAGCAQFDSNAKLTSTGVNCGTGGGGADPFTHPTAGSSATTSLMLLNGNASTTQFSVFTRAYFGGSATSTFDSTGFLMLPSGFNSQASSTVGGGTQISGLTVNGGSTTTLNAYFQSPVGINGISNRGAFGGNGILTVNGDASNSSILELFRPISSGASNVFTITFGDTTNSVLGQINGRTDTSGGTGLLQFMTSNGTSDLERMRITSNGLIGIATTTPFWTLTVASSTGPQFALLDGSATNFAWTQRAAGNNFYLASSTNANSATSSVSVLVINGTTGAFTFNAGATSTFTSGLNVGAINETGLSTSTFVNGVDLTSGCFSILGTCVGGSAGGVTSVSGTTNQITSSGGTTPVISLPNLVIFPNAASTTLFSVFRTAYFGGTSTTTISSTGAITAPSGVLNTLPNASTTHLTAGTSLGIPTASNPTPTSVGYVTQSTNNPYQLHVGNGAAGTAIYDPRVAFTFGIATTTSWTGTSTAPSVVIPAGLTWDTIYCTIQPSGSTLNAQYQYANATAYTTVTPTMVPASTTPGVYTWTSNNTPTTAATSTISFGTPGNSPLSASCTLTGRSSGV